MAVKHPTAADGTFSASGAAAWNEAHTIEAGTITLAMQANMDTASLVYRKTAGAGAPEVNTLATLKTDLGLTGTNSGDQTSIVGISGTIAQFNTACSDADFATGGGTATGTNTGDQTNISGNAATVTTNANLTGPVTSVGNATTIASGVVTEAMQVLADNTTQDVSTTKHGYAPKAPNDVTKFLNGVGTYSVPSGGGSVITWITKTLGYTAASGNFILADTSSAGFTITLPATPSANDFVVIKSGYYTSPSKILTIARNGSEIMNLAEDMTVTTPNIEMTLVYNATTGWTL